jgi:hypothetical protein
MKKIKVIFYFFILLFIIYSCNNQKFNRNIWINDDDIAGKDRITMVDDIVDSKMLENKDTSEIKYLLGTPQFIDTSKSGKLMMMSYRVQDYYGFDIDPKYSISLDIEVDTNLNKIKQVRLFKSPDQRGFIEKVFAN